MSNNQVFRIVMKDGAKLQKTLQGYENKSETAIKRTVSDFKSRAPGWTSKAIRQHYGVDTAAIKSAGPRIKTGIGQTHAAGKVVENAALEYNGKVLTLTHFKQSPKTPAPKGFESKRHLIPGQYTSNGGPVVWARKPKKYTIKATIKKSSTSFGSDSFITKSNGATLPFQRTADTRFPVKAIKTVSVPQMIDNDAEKTIYELIEENLGKRLENNVNQAMK